MSRRHPRRAPNYRRCTAGGVACRVGWRCSQSWVTRCWLPPPPSTAGIEATIKHAIERWQGELREFGLRRDRINRAIEKLEDLPHRSREEQDELAGLRGQRQVMVKHLRATATPTPSRRWSGWVAAQLHVDW